MPFESEICQLNWTIYEKAMLQKRVTNAAITQKAWKQEVPYSNADLFTVP